MRSVISLVLTLLTVLGSTALTRKNGVIVSVAPFDAFTGEVLYDAYAQIIDIHGDTISDSRYRLAPITIGYRTICLDLPDSTATYTVRTYHEGYEPGEFEFRTRRRGKNAIELPANKMVKLRRQSLNEVTVTASKVKMVMRGDTIVYNADAFQLANGSMLDALVSRLPGVTIEDGGRITVNGRQVDELTINGENFFNGNPRIALENLPAFTVKEIKVYESGALDSYITGTSVPDLDKPLRMDVNLKKEYVFGWMGNATLAYGLRNRYLAKAFAFGFTNTFRFSTFANFNNIKDDQSASGGQWTSGRQHDGEMDLQMGGADYMVKNKVGEGWTFRAQGSLIARGDQSDVIADRTETTFYPTRDLFKRSNRQTRSKRFDLNTCHDFQFKLPRIYATISPQLNFRRNNQRQTLSEKSAYDPATEELIYTYGMNSRANTEDLNLNLHAEATWDSRWRNDYARFKLDLAHHNSNENLFRNYALDYLDPLTPDRHGDEHNPSRSKEYKASAEAAYSYIVMNRHFPEFAYLKFEPSIAYDFRRNNNDVTRSKPQEPDSPLGNMASDEIKYIIDLNNSYCSQRYSHTVTPGITAIFIKWRFCNEWQLSFREHLIFDHIDYLKAGENTILNRRKALPEISALFRQQTRPMTWYVEWHYRQYAPDLNFLINTTDVTDPLNRYLGNPDLRNASEHSVNGNFQISAIGAYVDLGWKKTDNYVAYTKSHDETTGVNTWRPMNVNGNWTLSGTVRFGRPLGKKNNWSVNTFTSALYNHNVDLVTLSGFPGENLVHNTCLTENLSVAYTFGKNSARLGFSGLWRHTTSPRPDFAPINAFDLTPSFSLNLSLPYDIELKSDLRLCMYRGYSERELNTTGWGWNATLSKSILKGNLKFSLTGVDILGQIKPMRTVLNAQGRTETRFNTVPRYAMLHITYRLTIQPRRP